MQNSTREKRQGKRRVLFTELEVLLYEYDLAGINFGSNPDEYAIEVRAILARLHTESTSAEIRKMLHEIFVSYFSKLCVPSKDDPVYKELADEILMIWQRYLDEGVRGPSLYDFILEEKEIGF